jgi:DnaK suppressor protein
MNDIELFKTKLIEEEETLEEEIAGLGVTKVSDGNWDANAETGVDTADDGALADMFEDETTKQAVLDQLEKRLSDVKLALSKIANGGYGICEVSGESIEHERLVANPAARTNIANREAVL